VRVVVCDTGPVLHLHEAGVLDVLRHVGEILIPAAVDDELARLIDDCVVALPRRAVGSSGGEVVGSFRQPPFPNPNPYLGGGPAHLQLPVSPVRSVYVPAMPVLPTVPRKAAM
jgi:hypothetical protein